MVKQIRLTNEKIIGRPSGYLPKWESGPRLELLPENNTFPKSLIEKHYDKTNTSNINFSRGPFFAIGSSLSSDLIN